MYKYNSEKKMSSINGALKKREEINEVVDQLIENGFDNICWFGIGGTYASSMQVVTHMKERTTLDTFYENASEYLTTGNKRITDKTIIVVSSVTGSTEEMVKGVKRLKEVGAKIIGFIDVKESKLAKEVDYLISYPENEQLKMFMVADRIMFKRGEFPDYYEYYKELEDHLANAIVEVAYSSDAMALEYAERHHDDELHYFVGADRQWGATYSHAMCYWEEQHWLKTRAIHSAEFFHGMFEIITRDTPVTLYITEGEQRSLSMRVRDFLPSICGNYNVIDSKDYELKGISEKYRGYVSHLVIREVNDRIDTHIEKINRHPMVIRRYYRQLQY